MIIIQIIIYRKKCYFICKVVNSMKITEKIIHFECSC